MPTLYDGNGNIIEISGGGSSSSDFGVSNYAVYEDDDGSARQGNLTYQGKTFYPITNQAQRQDKVRMYDDGVMFTLGDSYTAYMNTFFDTFATAHGLVQDNRGLASSTIAGSEDGSTVGYHAFWVRLDEAISEYQAGYTIGDTTYTLNDVKLITFMGGANDWTTVDESQGIDRIGNRDSTNKEQLYGACNYIFNTLLSTFPNADIVVILQPSNESKGNNLMQLKEGIVREMAERYGLPICDCIFEWYNPSNPIEATKYWQTDKLHLTADGHQAVIDKLEKVVNNLPITRN